MILFLFSLLHRAACQVKSWLYALGLLKTTKAPLPVVSVGNIAFGGSEKTPLAMHLLSFFLQKGFRPALISRGYKGRWEKKGGLLSDGRTILGSWRDSGDEAFMVAQRIPQAGVFVGKDRFLSCRRAAEAGFELAVLDDGFQHLRLERNLDIVLYDPREKTALRELPSSLRRADVVLVKEVSDGENKEEVAKLTAADIFPYSVLSQGFFMSNGSAPVAPGTFQDKKVLAFCGIARPERFLSLLEKEGIRPEVFLKYPDHYSYPSSSLRKISKKCRDCGAEAALTTEKDALKVTPGLDGVPVYFLRIGLELDEKFDSRVSDILGMSR